MSDTYPEEYRQEVARMNDDTRQARIEQTARVIYGANPQIAEWEESTQYGAISRESVVEWESLDEYLDQVKVDVGEYAAVYRTDDLLKAADAAIQTLLPDRTAFERLLADRDALIAKSEQPQNSWRFDRVCDLIDLNKAALIALVYGDDDASGGTR